MGNTPNYGWEYPDVGFDVDTWGGIANDLYVDVDAQMKIATDAALAALPKAGGTMTGDIVMPFLGSTSAAVGGFKGFPEQAMAGDYTPVLADQGKMFTHTSASAHLFNIPTNASVAFPIGTFFRIWNGSGAGNVTVFQTVGTTVYSVGGPGSYVQGSPILTEVVKVATDTWFVVA